MKPCIQSEQDLLMYLHGVLSSTQSLRMRLHLVTCPTCRAKLAGMTSISKRVARALRNPTSPAPVGSIQPWKFRIATGSAIVTVGSLFILIGGAYLGISAFTSGPNPSLSDESEMLGKCRLKQVQSVKVPELVKPKDIQIGTTSSGSAPACKQAVMKKLSTVKNGE